jgi:hypothetical protein
MSKRMRKLFVLFGAVMVLALALGVLAVSAGVDEATPERQTATQTENPPDGESMPLPFARGDAFGFHGWSAEMSDRDTLLAEALGITVDDLEAAKEAAWQAGVEQMLEAGLITEAQAEQLLSTPFAGRGFGHHGGGFMFGGIDERPDRDALLAEALGISVANLEAAQAEAEAAGLAEKVAAGILTQEQADLMLAARALRETIDEQALLAEALGIDVADLEAARDAGQSVFELIDDLGLTPEEVMAARQAAFEAAVADAVADGVLNQDQADQILSSAPGPRGFSGQGFGGDCPEGGRHEGGPMCGPRGGFGGFGLPDQESAPTTTGLGA